MEGKGAAESGQVGDGGSGESRRGRREDHGEEEEEQLCNRNPCWLWLTGSMAEAGRARHSSGLICSKRPTPWRYIGPGHVARDPFVTHLRVSTSKRAKDHVRSWPKLIHMTWVLSIHLARPQGIETCGLPCSCNLNSNHGSHSPVLAS